MHGALPTPDPHRILGFHPDMGRSGEMVSSAAPPRRKAAPKGGVAAAGQPRRPRFPSDTNLLHQNTPKVDPARSKTEPGTGKGCMEGRGQYLQIWHGKIRAALDHHLRLAVLTAEPSGTPHATPAGAAAPGSEGLRKKGAPKTPPPPSPAPARAFPTVVSGGGEGVGEGGGWRRRKTLDSPESP